MKKMILLLLALLLVPLGAQAVTAVPEGVTQVGDEAFAGTGIDALIVPASVEIVGANVLVDCDASYLYLEGAATQVSGAPGTPFIFAPADSPAASLDGFYAAETLVLDAGIYYSSAATAIPLCAKEPSARSGSVTIPKLLDGVPVTTLEALYLDNTQVSEIRVPRYLTIPEGMTATPYQTLFITTPTADVTQTPAGRYVNWTTSVTGAYGDVTYIWNFTVGDETGSVVTTEPTVKFAPMSEGTCTVTVTAEDSLGDSATSVASEAVTVTAAQPVYRALLIGNTYAGTSNDLAGPDTDVYSMQTMLNTMTGTPFNTKSAINVTSSAMLSYIPIAFSGAQPADVSLFYYSGHGDSSGALITTDKLVTVYTLRNALQKIPGTKIVILDSCYSGSAIKNGARTVSTYSEAAESLPSPSAFNSAVISAFSSTTRSSENLADQGYIVLTSCRYDQRSSSLNDAVNGIDFGIFTYGICYGSGYDEWNQTFLDSMPADADGNAAITLGEAYAGAKERVAYLNTLLYGKVTQEAQYYGDTSFVLWHK